ARRGVASGAAVRGGGCVDAGRVGAAVARARSGVRERGVGPIHARVRRSGLDVGRGAVGDLGPLDDGKRVAFGSRRLGGAGNCKHAGKEAGYDNRSSVLHDGVSLTWVAAATPAVTSAEHEEKNRVDGSKRGRERISRGAPPTRSFGDSVSKALQRAGR